MKKVAFALALTVTLLVFAFYPTPGQAQVVVTRTWVSATGSDSNLSTSCQATAPCATFSTALSITYTGGEINCLGPVGPQDNHSVTTINQAITIDCHGTFGGTQANNENPFVINAAGAVVTLRGLNINGLYNLNGLAAAGAGQNGVLIQAGAVVTIEDCVIENFSQHGISDTRPGGGTQLVIKNTVVRNNTGPGIVAAAAATNSVVLENVQSAGNTYGIAVATGNHVTISRSIIFGNATAGIEADPGAQVYVDYTEIANNGIGVQAHGNVVLGNSGIVSNSTGISGATSSYGNNRIFGNSSVGTAPTLISQQ